MTAVSLAATITRRARIAALLLLTSALGAMPERTIGADDVPHYPVKLITSGVRYGTNNYTDKKGAMDRLDYFWSWRTPWAWEFTPGWDIGWRLNGSMGALSGQGEVGAMGTLVPTIAIGDTDNWFVAEAGAGAALLSRWEYGDVEDFGGPLQFILDAGFSFRVWKHLGLGYRFQHWSDAGIHGSDNRGVEVHLFEVSYRF